MTKKTGLFVVLALIGGFSAGYAHAAEEKTEVALLDSATLDKTGNLRYSYSLPAGCEKHESRIEFELKTEPSESQLLLVKSAKIHVFDVVTGADACKPNMRVEGSLHVTEHLQQAADLQSALIEDRRIPISLPEVNVFTGK